MQSLLRSAADSYVDYFADTIMSDNPKIVVEQAYDHLADWYLQWVDGQRSPRERYTNRLLEALPKSPDILELGCGPGVPVTRLLLDRGARVMANDISSKQINMAQARCPEATFHHGDMATLSFEPSSFDGVTCFFTIFHLPRLEQKIMLSKIGTWLKPGGLFVVNFATVDEDEIFGEMMGYGMFWSSYAVDESKAMLTNAGMEIVSAEEIESGEGDLEEGDADYGVKFVWVTAKKPQR